MGDPDVRRATREDAAGVYRVTRRNWETAFAEFLPAEAVDWPDEVTIGYRDWHRTVLDHEGMAELVAVDPEFHGGSPEGDEVAGGGDDPEGAVVGAAELAWDPDETRAFAGDDEAELVALHVDPDRWGEGIGTRLLEAAADAAPVDGMALGVLRDNDRARGFYERRGFEEDGTATTTIAGEEYEEVVYHRGDR